MNKTRTAASIRRSYMGARSRAEGAGFENIINSACAYYCSIGLADVEKTPEVLTVRGVFSPVTPSKPSRTTRAFSGAARPSISRRSTRTATA